MNSNFALDRRQFIGVTGLAAASLAAGRVGADDAPRRPNIILIQTDQQHHGVLACAGNPVVKTPHLDRLAAEGVRFSNATCATPFCSPTRASWVTGQWPHTHGLMKNVDGKSQWLTDERTNLPNILHDAGYACAHFGKWHLGRVEDIRAYAHQGPVREQNKGYNQKVGRELKLRVADIKPPRVGLQHIEMIPSVRAFHERWKNEKRRSPQDLSVIGRSTLPVEYQYESWLADQCISFIEENRARPFFATYSVSPPHAFWIAPDPYYSMYSRDEVLWPESWNDRPNWYAQSQPCRMVEMMGEEAVREYLRCYYAQVTMMDEFIGRIIERVRQLGLFDDTIIVFTSDHGDMQGAHGAMGKSLPAFYEEIVRVPLLVRVPGSRQGAVSTTHAQSVDLMPTLLDYVGLRIPDSVQGDSMRGIIDGTYEDDERPAFSERGRGLGARRMIRAGTWKYCVSIGPKRGIRKELYDLAEDPHEMRDLAGKPRFRDVQAYLDAQHQAGLREQDDKHTLAVWPEA